MFVLIAATLLSHEGIRSDRLCESTFVWMINSIKLLVSSLFLLESKTYMPKYLTFPDHHYALECHNSGLHIMCNTEGKYGGFIQLDFIS